MWHRKTGEEQADRYATAEDFCRLFAQGVDELYQLSFLLTADHQKAEKCFVAGLDDSVSSNRVFKESARSWAKRTIIENAIRQLKPHLSFAGPPALPVPLEMGELTDTRDSDRKLNNVLALPTFERFVFVVSVLEHYSEHDSGILLGCSPREIRKARVWALAQLGTCSRIVSMEADFEGIRELTR
jgi:hypothetical protein